MPIDPHAERFLGRLAALRARSPLEQTVEQRREALRHLLSFAGPSQAVGRIEDRLVPGPAGPLKVRDYTPAEVPEAGRLVPALLYFHGGGLVAGNLETHDGIARCLANASGCRVLALDYRLAPQDRFPAALEDGYAAACWVGSHAEAIGIDALRFGVCGDSAGATIAAVVCQKAAETQEVRLALQFLLCPILDYGAETPSRRRYATGFFLEQATLEHDLRHYLGPDVTRTDPRVSPLRAADVSRTPPTVVHTAQFDPLCDEGWLYAERLRGAGIRTLYRCHSGMIHLFYGMGALIPYAARAFEAMGADIQALLSPWAPRAGRPTVR